MFSIINIALATLDGIEPPFTESKSVVLPLNERAMSCINSIKTQKKPEIPTLISFYPKYTTKHPSVITDLTIQCA